MPELLRIKGKVLMEIDLRDPGEGYVLRASEQMVMASRTDVAHHLRWRGTRVAVAALLIAYATSAWCQSDSADDPVLGTPEVTGVGKIGRLHDNIRRAQGRE